MLYSNKQIQNLQNAIKKEIQEIPIQKDQKKCAVQLGWVSVGRGKEPDLNQHWVDKIQKKTKLYHNIFSLLLFLFIQQAEKKGAFESQVGLVQVMLEWWEVWMIPVHTTPFWKLNSAGPNPYWEAILVIPTQLYRPMLATCLSSK